VRTESASVCELPYPDFENLCDQLSSLRRQLMQLVGREINGNKRMLLVLGQMNAEERLATFLISLSKRFGSGDFQKPSLI